MDTLIIYPGKEKGISYCIKDLEDYWKKVCLLDRVRTFEVETTVINEFSGSKNLILVGNKNNNPLIETFQKKTGVSPLPQFKDKFFEKTGYKIEGLGNGFRIKIIKDPYKKQDKIIFLEGEDILGIQYAVYEFIERFLGVRYLSPYFEYIPQKEKVDIPEMEVIEQPDFPIRRIWVWNFGGEKWWDFENKRVKGEINRNWKEKENDPELWFGNGLLGDVEMMKKVASWAIKNKQNTIIWGHESSLHLYPPLIPQEYAEYEGERGLKTFAFICPGSNHLPQWLYNNDRHFLSNCCQKYEGELLEILDKEGSVVNEGRALCIKTNAYWEKMDEYLDWYEKDFNSCRNIIGYVAFFGEGCNNNLLERWECFRCDDMEHYEKWIDTIRGIKNRLRARKKNSLVGLVVFEISSVVSKRWWHEEFLKKLPFEDIFIEVRPIADWTWESFGVYWEMIDKINREKGKRLFIIKEAENIYMCKGDLPLISPNYWVSREHDFRRLRQDEITLGHCVNYYTSHYLEWFKNYYTIKNQWKFTGKWEDFIIREGDYVFGEGVGEDIVKIYQNLLVILKDEKRMRVSPYNQDTESWRGIQLRSTYLDHLFINLETPILPPSNIEEMFIGFETPMNPRISPFCKGDYAIRPFSQFMEKDSYVLEEDMSYYLSIIDRSYEILYRIEGKVRKNRDLFKEEFYLWIDRSLEFLRGRLLLVRSYCRFVSSMNEVIKGNLNEASNRIDLAIEDINMSILSLKRYEEIKFSGEDWVARNPDVKEVEELRKKYLDRKKKLCNKEIEKLKTEICMDYYEDVFRKDFIKTGKEMTGQV